MAAFTTDATDSAAATDVVTRVKASTFATPVPLAGAITRSSAFTSYGSSGITNVAHYFRVNKTVVVPRIAVYATSALSGGSLCGIASVWNSSATIPWLGKGTSSGGTGYVSITLDVPVTLTAGSFYELVTTDGNVGWTNGTLTLSGIVDYEGGVTYGPTFSSFSSSLCTSFQLLVEADVAPAVDTVAPQRTQSRAIAQTAGATDVVTRARFFNASSADAAGAADVVTRVQTFSAGVVPAGYRTGSSSSGSASLTLTIPTVTTGHWMFLAGCYPLATAIPATPAGWSLIASAGSGSNGKIAVYRRQVQAGDSATVVTLLASGGDTQPKNALLVVYDGDGAYSVHDIVSPGGTTSVTWSATSLVKGLRMLRFHSATSSVQQPLYTYNSTGTLTSNLRQIDVLSSGGVVMSAGAVDSTLATGVVTEPSETTSWGPVAYSAGIELLIGNGGPADVAPATDTVMRQNAMSRAIAQAAGAADVVTRAQSPQPRSIVDTAPVTDVASGVFTRARVVADSAPAVGVITRQITVSRAIAQTAAAVDVVIYTRVTPRFIAETIFATDVVVRQWLSSRAIAGQASASDIVTRARVFSRATADTAAAVGVTAYASQLRRMNETAVVLDAVSRVVVLHTTQRYVASNAPAQDTVDAVAYAGAGSTGDSWALPFALTGTSGTRSYNTLGMTREAGEPADSIGNNTAGTIWFRYSPTSSGTLTVTASDIVEIYDADPLATITLLGTTSTVVATGAHYMIRVHGTSSADVGAGTLTYGFTIRAVPAVLVAADMSSTPGILLVSVSQGPPGATVSFNLVGGTGNPLLIDVLDNTGQLIGASVPIPALSVGTYTLEAVV